ncbi:MAG: hypothetical protein ABSD03_02185 [Vulcanimicrobiaceae bacterium]|jgi:hypothetical protein
MRLAFMAFGTTVLAAAALAACTTSNPNNSYIAPPSGPVNAGPLALSGTPEQQQLPGADGITGVVTYSGGTGTVTATTSTTAPAATIPVNPSALRRAKSGFSQTVFYVTISSQAGATLGGLPGIALVLPSPAATPYEEAQFSGTAWTNVESGSVSGNSVQFASTNKPITIAAGGALYLAFYQGNNPEPTPTPTPTPEATPTNMISQPNFDSGTAVVYMTPSAPPVPTGTGWTQCSITAVASNAPVPINHPVSSYTPDPNETPAAVVMAAGATLAVGSSSPHPTQTTVPTFNSVPYAAVFGGVFSNYYAEDFGYDGLCQAITMPLGAALSMEIFANGNDGATYLSFNVDWLNTSGQFVANLYSDDSTDPITGTSAGDTAYRSISIAPATLAPYIGQQGELFIGVYVHAGSGSGSTHYSTYYFVDNVNLQGIP